MFIREFDTVTIQPNNNGKFFLRAYGLPRMSFWPRLQCRAWVSFFGVGTKPNQRAAVCPHKSEPLLHLWEHRASQVCSIVLRVYSLVGQLVPYFLLQPAHNLLAQRSLDSREEFSSSLIQRVLYILYPGSVVSSAIESHPSGGQPQGMTRGCVV